jgi:PiT family inorganic phosphate transporter
VTELVIFTVAAAFVFDIINGFHDAANSVATVVATRVLSPRLAVLWAAFFNFVALLFFHEGVAKTISGIVDIEGGDPAFVYVVMAGLMGAIAWNLLTWWWGLPSSSSHALIGGLCGAVVAHAGLSAFKWDALVKKVLVPIVVSPAVGFLLAFMFMLGLLWIVRRWRAATVESSSRKLQLVSAASMAFSHGSNDAQKAMGIITLALVAYATAGHEMPGWMLPKGEDGVPQWVVLVCAAAIGLGTMAGGQRIIKTMGSKIIRITPLQGFAAETSGALTILAASHVGIPVSTTHVISSSIMGVGAVKRLSAVRWGIAGNIVTAWVLTIPLSAGMAALFMLLFEFVGI